MGQKKFIESKGYASVVINGAERGHEEVSWILEFFTMRGSGRIPASKFFLRTLMAALVSNIIRLVILTALLLVFDSPSPSLSYGIVLISDLSALAIYLVLSRASVLKRCHDFGSNGYIEYVSLGSLLVVYFMLGSGNYIAWGACTLCFLYIWFRFGDPSSNIYGQSS